MKGDDDIRTVRDRMVSKIGSFLGTFSSGQPAIAIQPPIPPEFGSGCHCILERNSQRVGLSSNHEWIVSLVFVPGGSGDDFAKFDQALKAIRYWFPRSRELHSKYRGFYPQINFYLNFEREEFE